MKLRMRNQFEDTADCLLVSPNIRTHTRIEAVFTLIICVKLVFTMGRKYIKLR